MLHLVDGIFTDHGSFVCHAAIVSREMGIQCVAGAVDATRRIPEAARIRIDGASSEVTILMVIPGEHRKVMQSRVGHATPNLTLGLYAHVPDEVDRAAARRIEDLLTGTQRADDQGTRGPPASDP